MRHESGDFRDLELVKCCVIHVGSINSRGEEKRCSDIARMVDGRGGVKEVGWRGILLGVNGPDSSDDFTSLVLTT